MKKVSILSLIIVLLVGMMWNGISFADEEIPTPDATEMQSEMDNSVVTATGRITEASQVREESNGVGTDRVQDVTVEVLNGDYIGEEVKTTYNLSYDLEGKIQASELEVGDKVTVQITEDPSGKVSLTVMDVNRARYVVWIFVLFLASIVLIGGKNGLKAVFALVYTLIILYFVLVKNVLAGKDAIIYALISSVLVSIGSFIIIGGGINKKILTSALGTIFGVIFAGFIASIFSQMSKMSGASEEAIQLSINMINLSMNFRDLIVAGVLVASLGACMDVSWIITNKLEELKMVTPEITWIELFKSGLKQGKEQITTITNTLLLAYLGCSLTIIMLFMACDLSFIDILNKETVAEQIIPALSGSIGIIFTVPITALVYAIFNKEQVIYRKTSENKINGKRSLKI